MKKEDYRNSVLHQVRDLKELARIQKEKCFHLEKLMEVMGRETAAGIKRVIFTGCGDSYSAAGAMLPGFKRLSGLKRCNAPDIMDFCCYYTRDKILKGLKAEEVLVVAISFSGSAQRLEEALNKADDLGVQACLSREIRIPGAAVPRNQFSMWRLRMAATHRDCGLTTQVWWEWRRWGLT